MLHIRAMTLLSVAIPLGFASITFVQTPQAPPQRGAPEDHRPPLFLREDWREPPRAANGTFGGTAETPITQAYVTNPNLELKLYGPGKGEVQIVEHDSPKDDPSYVWTGLATGSWAIALRDRNNYVDLSGLAKIRWRVKEAGFHLIRPIIKLADGTWLVGDYATGFTTDWEVSEFSVADIRWRGFDSDKAVEASDGKWKTPSDLSKIDEVGFTDLSPGSGHGSGGASRVDWIEVYGNPTKR